MHVHRQRRTNTNNDIYQAITRSCTLMERILTGPKNRRGGPFINYIRETLQNCTDNQYVHLETRIRRLVDAMHSDETGKYSIIQFRMLSASFKIYIFTYTSFKF